MSRKLSYIIEKIEEIAPLGLAMQGDNCGLLIGNPEKEINNILIALDCSWEVINEAIERGCELIITHHPLIYNPILNLNYTDPLAAKIGKLAAKDIAVYSAHTSFDCAKNGVSQVLADMLGISDSRVLMPKDDSNLLKLAVYVPMDYSEDVADAIFAEGAGKMGNYEEVRFTFEGEGSFVPVEGANPYLGKQGEQENVQEVKIETIVEGKYLQNVINALIEAHPYEEPAFDIYPLVNQDLRHGLGIIGDVEKQTLRDFAMKTSKTLGVKYLKFAGDKNMMVSKVAVCGGSGRSAIEAAVKEGADVLVSGDIGYHDAEKALSLGVALIDAGHYPTEKPSLGYLYAQISGISSVSVYLAETESDIFNTLE